MTVLGLTEGSENTRSSGISHTKGNLMDQHSCYGDQLLLQTQHFCGLKKRQIKKNHKHRNNSVCGAHNVGENSNYSNIAFKYRSATVLLND